MRADRNCGCHQLKRYGAMKCNIYMLARTQVDHGGRLLVAGAARAARPRRVVQAALALGACMQAPCLGSGLYMPA